MLSASLASSASPGACDGLLESFLHDMEALDHQSSDPATSQPAIHPKRQKVDVAVNPPLPSRCSLPKKKKPSWLKRKQELETLRQQVQAMETRVAYLNTKQSPPNGAVNSLKLQQVKSSALVEKQRCIAAQMKNEQLRAKLKFYARQYEAFQMTIAGAEYQQKELQRTVSGALRAELWAGKQLHDRGGQVFEMMERRVDSRFHELEQAFQAMNEPLTSIDSDMIQTRKRYCGVVEFTRLELLPFEEKAISTTVWSFVESGKFPDGEHVIVSRRSEDSLAVNSRVTVQIDYGGVVTIDSHSVFKRFVTPEGFAVMVETYSDWNVDSPASGAWRHTTREGGSFVMRNYSADSGTPTGMCQARSFVTLHPGECVGKSMFQLPRMPYETNEVLVSSFRQLTNARHQFVQNALFDTMRS